MANNLTLDEVISLKSIKKFAKDFTDSRDSVSDPIQLDTLKSVERLTVFLSLKYNKHFSIMDTVDILYKISNDTFVADDW